MDFTNVSFSKELVAEEEGEGEGDGEQLLGEDLLGEEMLMYSEYEGQRQDETASMPPLLGTFADDEGKDRPQKQVIKRKAVNDYCMEEASVPQKDTEQRQGGVQDGEASPIHNTNNNSMNFSNIFN
jgi:hypothetical protein